MFQRRWSYPGLTGMRVKALYAVEEQESGMKQGLEAAKARTPCLTGTLNSSMRVSIWSHGRQSAH